MFGIFDFIWPPKQITSTLVFDEVYCHSAGDDSGEMTYQIQKGTTQIEFRFKDFEDFLNLYFNSNRNLPDFVKRAVQNGTGFFCAQVLQNGAHLCTSGVAADGTMRFNSQSLQPMNALRRLRTFTSGAIGFGIVRPKEHAFDVLWATMYTDAAQPSREV